MGCDPWMIGERHVDWCGVLNILKRQGVMDGVGVADMNLRTESMGETV